MFLNGLPTINRSCVLYKDRVLREECCQSSGIVVVPCLVNFFTERFKLLGFLLIGCVFFLIFHYLLPDFRLLVSQTTGFGIFQAPGTSVSRGVRRNALAKGL